MPSRTQYFWQSLETVRPIMQGKPIQCDVFLNWEKPIS
jgi:hypothetical protein